jgi:1,2-phenylacetyl-CoA epoxidase catalytic subunit
MAINRPWGSALERFYRTQRISNIMFQSTYAYDFLNLKSLMWAVVCVAEMLVDGKRAVEEWKEMRTCCHSVRKVTVVISIYNCK